MVPSNRNINIIAGILHLYSLNQTMPLSEVETAQLFQTIFGTDDDTWRREQKQFEAECNSNFCEYFFQSSRKTNIAFYFFNKAYKMQNGGDYPIHTGESMRVMTELENAFLEERLVGVSQTSLDDTRDEIIELLLTSRTFFEYCAKKYELETWAAKTPTQGIDGLTE